MNRQQKQGNWVMPLPFIMGPFALLFCLPVSYFKMSSSLDIHHN